MNVFGYTRVSTAQQLDGGGFDRQAEAIEQFCERKGWTLLRPVAREQHTGSDRLEDRKALFSMVERCGPETSKIIVVERVDRIGRELIVTELFFSECKSRGIEVYSADTGEELVNATDDPTRVLIRQVLGALAQWNKSELVKKLQAGRRRKALETGKPCGGIPRFGKGNDPEENLRALRLTNEVWRLRLAGHTIEEIADSLNESGHKTIRGTGKWSRATVWWLLKRDLEDGKQNGTESA